MVNIYEGKVLHGAIETDLANIKTNILKREIAVIKNVYSETVTQEIVQSAVHYFSEKEPKYASFNWGEEDYWRIDDRPHGATPKLQAIYFLFLWNNSIPLAAEVGKQLAVLRNKLADLPLEFGFNQKDTFYAIPCLQRYPLGGGFHAEHRDPIEPQRVVVSLTISKQGRDYNSGGLFVYDKNGSKVNIDEGLEPGDISIMHPGEIHGVDPVDKCLHPVDFNTSTGRWRMSTILTEY